MPYDIWGLQHLWVIKDETHAYLFFFDVNGLYLIVPQYLKWFETAITFDRSGMFPLIVDPIVGNLRFFEVLMDESSGLNIRYIEALVIMKVLCSEIKLGHLVEFSFRWPTTISRWPTTISSTSPLKWSISRTPTTLSLYNCATRNSRQS